MLVVVSGADNKHRPGLVMHLNPDHSIDIALQHQANGVVEVVVTSSIDRADVHTIKDAVDKGLVDWPVCVGAARNNMSNGQLVDMLVQSAAHTPDCMADIMAVMCEVPDSVKHVYQLEEPNLDGTALVKSVLDNLAASEPIDLKPNEIVNNLRTHNNDHWQMMWCELARTAPRKQFSSLAAFRTNTTSQLEAAAGILAAQQELMDTYRPSMLEILMIVCHFICPMGKTAMLKVRLDDDPISYAPNVLHNTSVLVDYMATCKNVQNFNVVDIGAGCQAALAGIRAACCKKHPKLTVNYRGINADNERYNDFMLAPAELVALSPITDFVPQAIRLVQEVHQGNEPTVVLVSWAPPDDDSNFLPLFLAGMAVTQLKPNLMLMIVGEGVDGCTGDGDERVNMILQNARQLHKQHFDLCGVNQVPGVMSHAKLFDWSDVQDQFFMVTKKVGLVRPSSLH